MITLTALYFPNVSIIRLGKITQKDFLVNWSSKENITMDRASLVVFISLFFSVISFVLIVVGYSSQYEWVSIEIEDLSLTKLGLFEAKATAGGSTVFEDSDFSCGGSCDQDTLDAARGLGGTSIAFSIISILVSCALLYSFFHRKELTQKVALISIVNSFLLAVFSISCACSMFSVAVEIGNDIDGTVTVKTLYGANLYILSGVISAISSTMILFYQGFCGCCPCSCCKMETPLLSKTEAVIVEGSV
jgi:hypothetical protein